MNLVDELHAIANALTAAGIAYAICGGIAVTIHGAVRTTKDIDILIERKDAEAAFAGLLASRVQIALPAGSISVVPLDVLVKIVWPDARRTRPTSRSWRSPMSRDMSPVVVARRLDELRAIYVPETAAEVQRRLSSPPAERSFEEAVERRLAELRALCELSAYLLQRRST